jgi:hypothetical protein
MNSCKGRDYSRSSSDSVWSNASTGDDLKDDDDSDRECDPSESSQVLVSLPIRYRYRSTG